jgi:heat shock protein HtpX
MHTTFEEQIASNKARTFWLGFFFVLIVGGIAYGISIVYSPDQAFVIVAVALVASLLYTWFSYYNSDKVVLWQVGAHEVSHADEPFLMNTIEGLCLAAGLPVVPRVFVIEDPAPNAFATGRDPQHAVVCVTRGLLEKMNRSQVEGVLSHELSHVYNRDILVMTIAVMLVGVIALMSDIFWRMMWWGGGGRRSSSNSGGGGMLMLVLFAIALILIILAPFIAQLMQLAISRNREYLADATGAKLTRNPEELASALEVIARDPEPLEVANKATAHLFIANPLADHGGWLNGLFDTHPPIRERIRRLRAM